MDLAGSLYLLMKCCACATEDFWSSAIPRKPRTNILHYSNRPTYCPRIKRGLCSAAGHGLEKLEHPTMQVAYDEALLDFNGTSTHDGLLQAAFSVSRSC